MAADWIKVRTDLQSHPKVVRILSATRTDKFRVIGGLHAVWGVFDTHTSDGVLRGYTPELLDHVIGWDGFARAMESVGWLLFDGLETLTLPEFEAHNGQSAKRRADDQKRKKATRHSVRIPSADVADKKRTRGEERREEEKKEEGGFAPEVLIPLADGSEHPVTLPDLTEFRAAYPRIDPLSEARKARAWCIANPAKRKTARGAATFLNGWMARAQKDAEKSPESQAALPGGGRRAL